MIYKDKWVPVAVSGTTGALTGLMVFATRWVLGASRGRLEPIEGADVVAAAIYDCAIELVVLFGLIGAILVTVLVYIACLVWEYTSQAGRAPSAPGAAEERPPARVEELEAVREP